MKKRSMTRMVGALTLVAALALGSTVAPAPVGADPADVGLAKNTMSYKYDLGGCRYKVMWGNFITTPYAKVFIYNPTVCGTTLVGIYYSGVTTSSFASSTTVVSTGSDGCGAYSVIQADNPAGNATRALVWTSTGGRNYDTDGTVIQAGTVC